MTETEPTSQPLPFMIGTRTVPIATELGAELLERTEGRAVIRFPVEDRFKNPMGVLQGGMFAVMLDMAMAMASNGLSTASLQVNLLRPSQAAATSSPPGRNRPLQAARHRSRGGDSIAARHFTITYTRPMTEPEAPKSPQPFMIGSRPVPIATELGAELLERTEGRAVIRFPVEDRFKNPMGVLQGGMFAVMLDMAMAMASNGLSTASLQVNLLRPAMGGHVTATEGVCPPGEERRLRRGRDSLGGRHVAGAWCQVVSHCASQPRGERSA